ncbi:MAG: GGDEF domain-containing protein [Deltaproteobacteria bacterium]|nr:GGDEF domain-containing protein [Deltaproteobacteria bacterium]
MTTTREEKTRVSQISKIADKRLAGGIPCFVQIYGKDIGRKYPLDKVQTTIGRGPDNGIVCDMDNVSRTHCKIYAGAGGSYIEDMGSTNGTFINDAELSARRKLINGDFIKVGGVIFKYIDGDNIEQLYYEEIYRMAIIDGLTQIYNKRYFMEFIDREMARCARYNRSLTLIMFDLDHFKKINDEFGHLAGDYVLKRLANSIMAKNIRKEECFSRYGGEEFCIVLPDTPKQNGAILAEKIRVMVMETKFEFETNNIPVTISMGVSEMQKGDTVENFIQRADDKLYEGKQGGRNRVMS